MVTEEGFDRLGAPVHYTYAWQYEEAPASDVTEPADAAEKKRADSVLSSLLTQTAVFENELIDFLPGYANQAIRFAPDDMGGDMAIGGVLLDILTVIIAFIFAITISNTISTEARTIGTLRASGYTKGELIRHYLAPPVAVTLLSAAAGNLLGYTVFKNTVVSMYYNSYSLPTYRTLWSPAAFLKTTLVPLLLMFLVNLAVIAWKMQYSPLRFLRGDLKRDGRRRAVRLPNLKFFRRFRLRIILQNLPSYLVLFFGVLFVSVMLAMAVGMPDTLDYYKENADGMMLANYQYILNSYKNEDGSAVRTENADAEPFCMRSLQRKGGAVDEEIGVYGILPDSRCVAADLRSLTGNEVYISGSFRDKYGVSAGDTVTLDEKYENRRYSFKVVGFYDRSASLAVFLTAAQFRTVFGEEADAFTGFLSGSEITDLPDGAVAAVVTSREITKMCDQLDHSMGSYMQYFQVLCILLSAVMLYLLSKLVIEKNGIAISIVKILGYEDREIASLYLRTTALVLLLADAVCTALGGLIMRAAWGAVMAEYSGWYAFRISPVGYAKMFLFVLIGYLLVMFFDYRRIRKIPMEQALKNAE